VPQAEALILNTFQDKTLRRRGEAFLARTLQGRIVQAHAA